MKRYRLVDKIIDSKIIEQYYYDSGLCTTNIDYELRIDDDYVIYKYESFNYVHYLHVQKGKRLKICVYKEIKI